MLCHCIVNLLLSVPEMKNFGDIGQKFGRSRRGSGATTISFYAMSLGKNRHILVAILLGQVHNKNNNRK